MYIPLIFSNEGHIAAYKYMEKLVSRVFWHQIAYYSLFSGKIIIYAKCLRDKNYKEPSAPVTQGK